MKYMVDGDNVLVKTVCPFCGGENIVVITKDQFDRFCEGGVMAVLDLSADVRELLKTGICSKCWPSDPADEDEE